ncbi:MAG: ArsA family ATPase [Deltaproteobacteria bacterium]|nr:ArsA family ATPase [Deltaproteobacteria bacterium]
MLFVLGKGGVGKSVVSASLGLLAAERGRRAIITEAAGAETMAALFDREPVGYTPGRLATNLQALSIQPGAAVEEYLVRTLKFRLVYEMVFRNRFVEPFMSAVMGLSDLITVGKVMDLEWERVDGSFGPDAEGPNKYDLIIVDSPATGHGLSLLRSPQAMMDVTRVGPLFNNARLIRDLLADEQKTGVVLVTLAEDMPVSETIQAATELRERGNVHISGIVVNGVVPPVFDDPATAECWDRVRRQGLELGGAAAESVRDAERSLRDRNRAEEHIARLRETLGLPLIELPLLSKRDLDAKALAELGTVLGAWS